MHGQEQSELDTIAVGILTPAQEVIAEFRLTVASSLGWLVAADRLDELNKVVTAQAFRDQIYTPENNGNGDGYGYGYGYGNGNGNGGGDGNGDGNGDGYGNGNGNGDG